jgi:hypothetical protein
LGILNNNNHYSEASSRVYSLNPLRSHLHLPHLKEFQLLSSEVPPLHSPTYLALLYSSHQFLSRSPLSLVYRISNPSNYKAHCSLSPYLAPISNSLIISHLRQQALAVYLLPNNKIINCLVLNNHKIL